MKRRTLTAVLAATVAVVVLLVTIRSQEPVGAGIYYDDGAYLALARSLADGNGYLAGIQLGDRSFGAFHELRSHILGLIGGDAPGGFREAAEIELDCDYDLRYEHVIQAVTAVTGYRTADGNVVRLIEKIKNGESGGRTSGVVCW